MGEGWIKLYSKFLDWEWYRDNNVKAVFIHLLITANYKDKRCKGKVIKRGQVLTSAQHLADALGFDRKTIIRCLDCLTETNEIEVDARKGRYGGTLISITKYNEYNSNCGTNGQLADIKKAEKVAKSGYLEEVNGQYATDCETESYNSNCGNNGQIPPQLTGQLPPHNIRNIEYKNIYPSPSHAHAREINLDNIIFLLETDTLYLESVAMVTGVSIEKIKSMLPVWKAELISSEGADVRKTISDARNHFKNYLRIYLRKERQKPRNSTLHFKGEKQVKLRIS